MGAGTQPCYLSHSKMCRQIHSRKKTTSLQVRSGFTAKKCFGQTKIYKNKNKDKNKTPVFRGWIFEFKIGCIINSIFQVKKQGLEEAQAPCFLGPAAVLGSDSTRKSQFQSLCLKPPYPAPQAFFGCLSKYRCVWRLFASPEDLSCPFCSLLVFLCNLT